MQLLCLNNKAQNYFNTIWIEQGKEKIKELQWK